MKRDELIEQLDIIRRSIATDWDDGMGLCGVTDFIDIPESIQSDAEIMQLLWRAVERTNAHGLATARDSIVIDDDSDDDASKLVWEQWSNGDIKFDYTHIQNLIDNYDVSGWEV